MVNPLPVLDAHDLRALAADRPATACPRCAALVCPGWEAIPGTFDTGALRRIGTLRQPEVDDPTLAEYHPGGTHAWSPDAPIAVDHHPYNRCDVWECAACRRPFLRYTEYGGYYQEERVRALRAQLVA